MSVVLAGCSASKFLSDDQTILSHVNVKSTQKAVSSSSFQTLVRQRPNSRWFNLVKVPLGIYCMSGRDSAQGLNKLIRRLGEAPVVYQASLSQDSRKKMQTALVNRGYLHADVGLSENIKRRRVRVLYTLKPGRLYTVGNISWDVENESVSRLLKEDSAQTKLYKGMPCNVSLFESERSRIVKLLQNHGYYNANKELITFDADTLAGSANVDLTVKIKHHGTSADSARSMRVYSIRRVNVYNNIGTTLEERSGELLDSLSYGGSMFYFPVNRPVLKPKRIANNMAIKTGKLYREEDVQKTYQNLGKLPIVMYSNAHFNESPGDSTELDCDMTLHTGNINSIGFELDGTNTAGDLGAAAVVSYTNRNLFRGGEQLGVKLRGAFEAITGLEDYADQNYFGISFEVNLKFPHFVCPFVSSYLKRTARVTSEGSIMYDSQNRPEFHRRVLTAVWRYRWASWGNRMQHSLDLLNLNYVFMPWISDNFRKNYLDSVDNSRKSILRYSYQNLLIAKIGYNFTFSSLNRQYAVNGIYQTNAYQIKVNIETAGNLLYGISKLLQTPLDEYGHRTLFKVAFAEYAKFDFDYAKSFLIDERNSMAFHLGFGVAIPYGNASVVPYEKRYFSGGANSVRGWSVRGLGPGKFRGKNGRIDFINQTGDVKLDINLEYRTFLFWKLHGALFIDAGNIWTIRKYSEQAGGDFRFDKFLEQIAVSYGAGLRLNFDYFIIRFDAGMKAINPAYTDKYYHYPIAHPRFNRDFTFHFAVGLPF